MFDIQEELKKLPGQPGVYIMHDEQDAIIYVGKAVSLKNRVRPLALFRIPIFIFIMSTEIINGIRKYS